MALFFTLFCLGVLQSGTNSFSDPIKTLPKHAIPGFKLHLVGEIWTVESNYGIFGDPNSSDNGNPSYKWPGADGYNYLWEGRVWIGVKVGDSMYVSHSGYGEYEFSPSEEDGDSTGWGYVGTGVSNFDITSIFLDYGTYYTNSHPLGIKVWQKAYQWSSNPFNQFIAYEFFISYNKNEGMPGLPLTLSNLYVGILFDADVCSYDTSNPNIDDMVCFDGYTWGEWADLSNYPLPVDHITLLSDTVFYNPDSIPDNWQIFGDESNENPLVRLDTAYLIPEAYHTLDTSIQAMCIPSYVPSAGDSVYLLPCLAIPRNMSFMYDDDDTSTVANDIGENGRCPGYIFTRLIYAPPAQYDLYGIDANGDSTRIPLVFSHSWWNWNNDPLYDSLKYQYLSGIHPANLGYRFMPHPLDVGTSVFDYRYLQSYGPFELTDGETLKLVVACGIGYGLNGGYDSVFTNGYLLGARQVADYALKAYYMGSSHSDPAHPSAPDEDYHWQLNIGIRDAPSLQNSEISVLNTIVTGENLMLSYKNISFFCMKIYSLDGRLIYTRDFTTSSSNGLIKTPLLLNPGVYFVLLEKEEKILKRVKVTLLK